ncbi:acid protease [Cenococcum geophilum 1.58]|uniref:acid protease n=1 Tax=Cenococcum geophilum 1.58 TaxID=794803 RepID=UPI00358E4D17|nr:acid protease [Cenococcum geophilum 1.58]
MIYARSLVAASLLLSVYASPSPANIYERDNTDGFVAFPVQAIDRTSQPSFRRRQAASPLTNKFTGTFYQITLSIGSNSQNVSVQLDTGSSELWVNPDCTTAPTVKLQNFCESLSRYNPATSTSSNNLGDNFELAYGKGEVDGVYYTDDIKVGSSTIKGQQFGVASDSIDLGTGILGVGLHTPEFNYPSFIESLAAQGQTKSVAFSLDLRSVDEDFGSVIFGGIDTKKYKCDLAKSSIIPASQAPGDYPRYWIYLTGIGQTVPGQSSKSYALPSGNSKGLPVFLDSGGTLSSIPASLFTAIGQDYPGARLDSTGTLYDVPCNAPSGSIDFTFGGKTISVAYSDFIWNTDGTCFLGIKSEPSGEYVLGDSFLRAAYVVYDVDNQNLWLDQADECGSNVIAIGKGPDAVPQVKGCGCGSSSTSSSVSKSVSTSSEGPATVTSTPGTTPVTTPRVTPTNVIPSVPSVPVATFGNGTATMTRPTGSGSFTPTVAPFLGAASGFTVSAISVLSPFFAALFML